ncbi:hypothetical protein N9118_06140 [Akkermansiaceae bacterium]|jgi:predicted outer membrane protein|nr:hypothetical protein [Akkermansiaceae bacterium]
MKNTLKFALTALLFAAAPFAQANTLDCVKVSNAVRLAVAADSDKVLEIVAKQIAANESCACEVVKAAIIASDAKKEVVAQIVDVAINEAPSMLRIIAQCAIAIAPDAQPNIQAILEKYDFAGGEGDSEKGALDKGGVPDEASANPLDFPASEGYGSSAARPEGGAAPVGPAPGGPGGFPLLPPGLPLTFPPVVTPPSLTAL